MNCPICNRWAPADPETGYDADEVCPLPECQRAAEALEQREDEEPPEDAA